MAGKISEYVEIAVKKATDLVDMSIDLGAGLFETRSITLLNMFKPRTKSVTPSASLEINFGFETTVTVITDRDMSLELAGVEAGGKYQLYLVIDGTARTVTFGTSFGANINNAPSALPAYPNRTYLVEISVTHAGAVLYEVKDKYFIAEPAVSGTDTVVFKSTYGYYTRTLTAIKNFVKSLLYASEVLNDSTATGVTVKDVLDVAEAVPVPDVLGTDGMASYREGVGNVLIPWSVMRSNIGITPPPDITATLYVKNGTELDAAFATEVGSIDIVAEGSIQTGTLSNVYPDKVRVSGRKITYLAGVFLPNSSSAGTVKTVYFDASVYMIKDPLETVIPVIVLEGDWLFIFRDLVVSAPLIFTVSPGASVKFVSRDTIQYDAGASTGTYSVEYDATLDVNSLDVHLSGSNLTEADPNFLHLAQVLINDPSGVQVIPIADFKQYVSGTAGTWSFSYDGGDVKVYGDASVSGRFGIKVKFKFKQRAEPFICNLFPASGVGTWVRFEHADWCLDSDRVSGGDVASLDQSFSVKGFFDSLSDFTQTGNYSAIAGSGSVYENQQDDGFRYLSTSVRIQNTACTFTVGANAAASTKEVWLLIHLSGTIL